MTGNIILKRRADGRGPNGRGLNSYGSGFCVFAVRSRVAGLADRRNQPYPVKAILYSHWYPSMHVTRHGKLPPRRHEKLRAPLTTEERGNEQGTNCGKSIVEQSAGAADEDTGRRIEDVAAEGMRAGLNRIARHPGCSHHTAKRYVRSGGTKPFRAPRRPRKLDGHEEWLGTCASRYR